MTWDDRQRLARLKRKRRQYSAFFKIDQFVLHLSIARTKSFHFMDFELQLLHGGNELHSLLITSSKLQD